MGWVNIETVPVNLTSDDFWRAVGVWNRVPHVVNRRLACTETLYREKIGNDRNFENLKIVILEAKKSYPSMKIGDYEEVLGLLSQIGFSFSHSDRNRPSLEEIVLKRLLPKNPECHAACLELEILEHGVDAATYVTVFQSAAEASLLPPIPYKLALINNKESTELEFSIFKEAEVENQDGASERKVKRSVEWLRGNLLPKFCRWAATSSSSSMGSLKLVSVSSYSVLYQSLKNKYAAKLMTLWPESTDPRKFIHEDLGIAAYLILLWEKERNERKLEKKQSFVDIGCGNGLLVYILTEEGYPGVGVDVRSRRIWDIYPSSIQLKVCVVNPSEKTPFPASDWLIGNHSDELTPWIPVMAAMNPDCRFFVLPCCPYDFFSRYGRKNPGKSIYQEYLEYIKRDVSEQLCKFFTNTDRLRIPSTKRVCIVGSKRAVESTEEANGNVTPHKFLIHNLGYKILLPLKDDADSINVQDSALFVPRPAKERVCNCTKIDANVITEVVTLVAAELLSGHEDRQLCEGGWDSGRNLSLDALAKVIPCSLLEKLKKESGGLQTLLKNNHFIFKVIGGVVSFRKPIVKDDLKKSSLIRVKSLNGRMNESRWKSKPCWFNLHHPNGCPLSDVQCSYIHEK